MGQANAQSNFNPKLFIKLQADIGIPSGQLKHWMTDGSIDYLRMAAEAGSETANFLMAKLLYCGESSDKNVQESFVYLDNLINRGSSIAPWLKGIAHFYGDGITKDEPTGLHLIEMAGIRGNPYAANWMISHLSQKNTNPKKYLWWLNFGASHGETAHQWQLANELIKTKSANDRKAAYYWLLEITHAIKDERALALAAEIDGGIDAESKRTLKEGVEKSGKFRWMNWNEDAMVVGASILPCLRHSEHPELSKLQDLTPRY
jgi:TPR repeat protein